MFMKFLGQNSFCTEFCWTFDLCDVILVCLIFVICRICWKFCLCIGSSEECDSLDDSQVSELTLKESLGNYFVEIVKKVDTLTLEATLTTCEEKSVKMFWNVIAERLPVNTA